MKNTPSTAIVYLSRKRDTLTWKMFVRLPVSYRRVMNGRDRVLAANTAVARRIVGGVAGGTAGAGGTGPEPRRRPIRTKYS